MQDRMRQQKNLEDWFRAVCSLVRAKPGCSRWAEDVAGEFVKILLERHASGTPVPECPIRLDDETRRIVNRIAASLCPRGVRGINETSMAIGHLAEDTCDEAPDRPLIESLRPEFSSSQTEAMILVCATTPSATQGNLAVAAGLSLRSFKRRIKRIREIRVVDHPTG